MLPALLLPILLVLVWMLLDNWNMSYDSLKSENESLRDENVRLQQQNAELATRASRTEYR